jgi:hypothetical protein
VTSTSFFAVLLAASLVQPPSETAPPASEPNELARAQRLYEEGKARYDTYDYAGAIEIWTRVYADVPDEPEYATIRNNLVNNIATAQIMAYRQDGDALRLKRAKQLLERYLEGIGDAEGEAEIERVRSRLAEIDHELERSTAPEVAPPPQPAPQPQRRGRGLVIGGAVVASAGVALSSGMIAGLVLGRQAGRELDQHVDDELAGMASEARRRAVIDDGVFANRLAIGAGVTAGVLVVVGTILAVVGATRAKRGSPTRAAASR